MDEADKLLSDFFKRVVDAIIRKLPVSRQILLYSATFPQSVIVSTQKTLNELHILYFYEIGIHFYLDSIISIYFQTYEIEFLYDSTPNIIFIIIL